MQSLFNKIECRKVDFETISFVILKIRGKTVAYRRRLIY